MSFDNEVNSDTFQRNLTKKCIKTSGGNIMKRLFKLNQGIKFFKFAIL